MTLYDFCMERGDETLLREWDQDKNIGKSPENITAKSRYRAFWHCSAGHTWQSVVYSRTSGCGCPYCAGKKVWPGDNDLASRFPQLAAQWYPDKNGSLTPEAVTPYCKLKVWWKCDAGHEWQAAVQSCAQGGGCPICANRVILKGYNDLATTHPELAREWDGEKNGTLRPTDVFAGSLRRVWWKCGRNPNHKWRISVADRAGRGSSCPVCQGRMVLAGDNDLLSCFPHIAAEWDAEKNRLSPQQVTAYSRRIIFWRCPLGHSYSAAVMSRTSHGTGCPYCSGRKVLAGFNDLAALEPQIAAQWHPTLNGTLTPEMVTVGSRQRVYWECGEHHVWQAAVYSRTGPQKTGCPVCAGNYSAKRKARYDAIMERARAESPIQE